MINRWYRKFSELFDNPNWIHKYSKFFYWRIYNFSWERWHRLFNNALAKNSTLASFIGYLIVLNDLVASELGFEFILNGSNSVLNFNTRTRLHLLFFGLLFIALARLIFLCARPHVIKFGPTLHEWVNFGLREFTFIDFQSMNGEIRAKGHRTIYGKYYDDDWDAFVEDAIWKESGRTSGRIDGDKRESRQHVNYSTAKQRHEDLLRCILIDRYYEVAASNKPALLASIILALPGYVMFLLPSIDLSLSIAFSVLF